MQIQKYKPTVYYVLYPDLCALAKKTNDIALSLVVQNANEECNINNNAGKNNAISLVMQYFFGEYNVCFW